MARSACGRLATLKTLLALLGLIAIPVTYGLVTGWNPLPGLRTRLAAGLGSRLAPNHVLATPAATWTVRLGDTPSWAAGAGDVVVIGSRGGVEARDGATGTTLWSRPVDYAAVAGSDGTGGPVVVAGRRGHGYDVLDPRTGTSRWAVSAALGVWTYRDMIVDVACTDLLTCVVTAHIPRTGLVLWHSPLGGNGRPLSGANRPLAQVRPLDGTGAGAGPVPAPPLLGFPVDDKIQVIATTDGRHLRAYQNTQRAQVVVAGHQVLVTTVTLRGGNCRYAVAAHDPGSDAPVWRRDGYDLHTASGGCDQRDPPAGAAGLVRATGPDNRDVLLDADTGEVRWQAPGTGAVVAVGAEVAVVRADTGALTGVRLSDGRQVWSRPAGRAARVSAVPGAVVIADTGAGTFTALAPLSGQARIEARSAAGLLGYTGAGLVVNIGRTTGLLAYTGA